MEKFKEKKIVKISNNIIVFFGIMFLLFLVLSMVKPILIVVSLSFLSLTPPFYVISSVFSKRNDFTKKFISNIENRLSNCNDLNGLKEIKNDFEYVAVDKGVYCLSYVRDIRLLHFKILSHLEMFNKLKNV